MKNYLMLFISSVSIDTRTLKPRESAYRIFGNDENVMTTQTNESAFFELVMREGGVEKIFVFASYDVRQKYIGYWNDDGETITWLGKKLDDTEASGIDIDSSRFVTSLDYFKWLVHDYVDPDNVIVCDYDENSDINQSIVSMNDMATKIISAVNESGDDVVLHADMTGGLRNASMMMLGVMRLMEYSNIQLGRILYSNWGAGPNRVSWVEDAKKVYDFFDLVAGAKEFARFGSVKEIKEYYTGNTNVSVELKKLIDAMESFSENIKLCHYGEFIDTIKDLKTAIREINNITEEFAGSRNVSESDKLFKILLPTIEKEYGGLLRDDLNDLEIIRWCVDKGYLQQAMTLFTERVPEYIFDNGILTVGEKYKKEFEKEYNDYLKTNKGSKNFYAFFNWRPQDPRGFNEDVLKSFINCFRSFVNDILKGKIDEDKFIKGVELLKLASEINTENVILEFSSQEVVKCFEMAYSCRKLNRLPDGFSFKPKAKAGVSLIIRKDLSKKLSENDLEKYKISTKDAMAAMKFIANNASDDVYTEAFKIKIRYTDKYHRELRTFVINNRLLKEKLFVTSIENREVLNKIIEDYYLIKDERNSTNHARPVKGQSTAEMLEELIKDALIRLRDAKDEGKVIESEN